MAQSGQSQQQQANGEHGVMNKQQQALIMTTWPNVQILAGGLTTTEYLKLPWKTGMVIR